VWSFLFPFGRLKAGHLIRGTVGYAKAELNNITKVTLTCPDIATQKRSCGGKRD